MPLGLRLELPEGTYGQLLTRSSSAKRGMTVEGGVIDADYRGEVAVILYNHTDSDIRLGTERAIAQLLVLPVRHARVRLLATLSDTTRGGGGFGSTDSA